MTAIKVSGVEVYAARLRLVTDRKQRKVSPDWVVRLASTDLSPRTADAWKPGDVVRDAEGCMWWRWWDNSGWEHLLHFPGWHGDCDVDDAALPSSRSLCFCATHSHVVGAS